LKTQYSTDPKDPREVFEKELAQIEDSDLRNFTIMLLGRADPKFWYRPASSTLKYHPAVCNELGGLIIHTKRVFYFAATICFMLGLHQNKKDEVLAAALLHDLAKTGKGEGTYKDYEEHPLNVKKIMPENWDDILDVFAETSYLDVCRKLASVFNCIENHMGKWTPAKGRKPMEEYSEQEKILHIADMLATDKAIEVPIIDKGVDDGV